MQQIVGRTIAIVSLVASLVAADPSRASTSPTVLERLLSRRTLEYLTQGYRADAPEYATKYGRTWNYVRYPVRKGDLGDGGLIVLDNVRIGGSADRSRITWGAAAFNPAVVKDVYLVFNSFDLSSDAEYADMEQQAAAGSLTGPLMGLLTRVAPLYLRTSLRSGTDDPAALRREFVKMMVGHAQLYFEFYPDWCVVGDGRGTVRATPGLVVSLDACGRRGTRYDPFAGLDDRTYDALYNIVDIRDALRWSTTSDTSTTFFQLHLSRVQKGRLLDRMFGIAFDEQPLTRFDDGQQVTISQHRYNTLFHSCINTTVRLVNEQFEPSVKLPELYTPCEGMPSARRSDNDICTLFDELRLPSAETSVFGVVGNALVGRGLATKLDDYPATIRRMIDEADDIDVHPSYPDYDIAIPGAAPRRNSPTLDGLNMVGGD